MIPSSRALQRLVLHFSPYFAFLGQPDVHGNTGRREAGAKNNRVSHAAALGGVVPTEPESKTMGRGGGEKSIFPSASHVHASGFLFLLQAERKRGRYISLDTHAHIYTYIYTGAHAHIDITLLFLARKNSLDFTNSPHAAQNCRKRGIFFFSPLSHNTGMK